MESAYRSACRSGRLLMRLPKSKSLFLFIAVAALTATTPLDFRPESASGSTLLPSGRSVSQTCADCHTLDQRFSHPVGVVPLMAVPPELPLENGRITCTTCHDFDAASHQLAGQRHNSLLRTTRTDGSLCAACHNSYDQNRQSMHATSFGRAHIDLSGKSRHALSSADLDAETRTCLGCHDGTLAPDVGTGGDGIPGTHVRSHPVGIAYVGGKRPGAELLISRGGFGQLRPVSMLDSRLRLFNQQVGCGTCHSPYAKEKGLLVMSNDHSRLCLSCHQDR